MHTARHRRTNTRTNATRRNTHVTHHVRHRRTALCNKNKQQAEAARPQARATGESQGQNTEPQCQRPHPHRGRWERRPEENGRERAQNYHGIEVPEAATCGGGLTSSGQQKRPGQWSSRSERRRGTRRLFRSSRTFECEKGHAGGQGTKVFEVQVHSRTDFIG